MAEKNKFATFFMEQIDKQFENLNDCISYMNDPKSGRQYLNW